jgi:hypothetical protein
MRDSDNKKTEIIVLYNVPSHQALAKSSRWRLRGVVLIMALIVVAGFWLMPSKRFFDSYATIAISDVHANASPQSLSSEVATLKGQLVGIVSGSIESKLSTLEQSLRSGAVNTSLGAIQDLKNDVKLLRTYSATEKPQPQNTVANQQLIEEMSHLKRLIYLTIASCGLMLAAVTGIWIRNLKKLPYQENITRFLGKH